MNNFKTVCCLTVLAATSFFFLAGFHDIQVSANNTPQTIPFAQNWTNTGLITTNDDWSGVAGIVGYLGDISAASTTNVDPRTLLLDYSSVSAVDVIANQTTPDSLSNGGVAEFEITNPTIALNGSGTADAPHIIVYLNTTGQSNIHFACNIRDLDASADDAVQQIDVQYRVGATGDFASVPGGYIADATTAGTATQVTALNLTLPAAANNQSLVQVRVMTTNAAGNDEWVGIDDISVTGSPAVAIDAPVDFNGDGKTDFAVTYDDNGSKIWFYNLNGIGGTVALRWGITSDFDIPEDYDGDGKDDIAVWRFSSPTPPDHSGAFYILQSSTQTVRIDTLGLISDDPNVTGDYDGDGRADPAVYRMDASQNFWFYIGSLNNPNRNITYVPWGRGGDLPAPGDYDGDGKNDFVVRRSFAPTIQSVYWKNLSASGVSTEGFGTEDDRNITGDFDGDGKTDLAVVRGFPNQTTYTWYIRPSAGGSDMQIPFGSGSAVVDGDYPVPGDYNGDGKTDVAVWRPGGQFWFRNSGSGTVQTFTLGGATPAFHPVGFYNLH